jgi:hypothetical protein
MLGFRPFYLPLFTGVRGRGILRPSSCSTLAIKLRSKAFGSTVP